MAKNGKSNGLEAHRRRVWRNQRRKGNGHAKESGASFPLWAKAIIAVGALGFIGLLVASGIGVVVYQSYADKLVAPDEFAINQPSFGARILDRHGNLLYEYVDDKTGLRRPIGLDQISDAFLAATIATEDDSFFTNPGVNIKGLARATYENTLAPFLGGDTVFEGSGGSSITQQLVKNVYIPEEDRQKREIGRKIKETVYALELTQRYEKEQILTWYVNQISYGGVYNGVQAASLGYFGKEAKDLTLAEAALLAGIPQSPAFYDPVNSPDNAFARRNQILTLIERQGRIQIGKDRYYEVKAEDIAFAREEPVNIAVKRFPIEAPHFVLQYVEPQLVGLFGREALLQDGLVVTTSLDLGMQHRANDILERWITEFEKISASKNGSVMVMDPKTAEILVMIGSRDYFSEDIEGKNNNATACNSPGSSFKPFAYLTAFQELNWGPGTVILDTPVSYPQIDGTVFTPINPAKNFQGPITIRTALGNSLNVPAVKTAAAVSADKIVNTARQLGFMNTFRSQTQPGGCSLGAGYGPAIATGGVDVTLEEMMFGYTVLANGGIMRGQETLTPQERRANERKIDPVAVLKVTDNQGRVRLDIDQRRKEQRVAKEEQVFLISSILSDSSANCITFGCGNISVPGRQAAVKTGTSEPFAANSPNAGKIGETWAFAYTPDLVVGIWAGNADNSPVINIFSTSISFRTVRDVMQAVYDGRGSPAFARPAGVVEGTVCVPSGLKPTPLCGRTTTDLFVKEGLPQKDDDWWRRVRIDVRNGLLAAVGTPNQFVQEQVMLVLPPELLATEEQRKQALEWASVLNLPLAPTETSAESGNSGNISNLPAIIVSPSAGANVTGLVTISGRADSDRFRSYRLEFGSGASPTSWTRIEENDRPVQSGALGRWNTDTLPPGIYTLRLIVEDRQRGDFIATVTVNVNMRGGPNNGTGLPPLQP